MFTPLSSLNLAKKTQTEVLENLTIVKKERLKNMQSEEFCCTKRIDNEIKTLIVNCLTIFPEQHKT